MGLVLQPPDFFPWRQAGNCRLSEAYTHVVHAANAMTYLGLLSHSIGRRELSVDPAFPPSPFRTSHTYQIMSL